MTTHKISSDWLFTGPADMIIENNDYSEKVLAPVWKTVVVLIGILTISFIGWASVASVEEVTKASGSVVPSSYVQAIQHLEGGIVREILIEEGRIVRKGEALIRLDNTTANADLGQMKARQTALAMQAARLRSYAIGGDDAVLTEEERAILQSMEEARGNQMSVLSEQMAQRHKELEGLSASRRALEKSVAMMEEEVRIHESMAEKGIGSKLMALNSQRELVQVNGQLSETRSQEQRARKAIAEAQSRLQSLDSDLRQEAMKNLGQVEAELSEINQTITKLESVARRTTIESPVNGIVKGLAVHTEGAVIEPGRLLMEIVPIEDDLVVEAMVSPTQIGNLVPGQKASIKVSAYDFARYGSVTGILDSVSATSFQTEEGESFYKMKIRLDQNHVGTKPGFNIILPGMTVQADIITGKKTILQYLLKPLRVVTDNAFYER